MKELGRSLLVFISLTVLTGFLYPAAMTGIASRLFPRQSQGSLIALNGKIVGSSLIGQKFSAPRYFHGRPSAVDYDAGNSGGANLGPDSKKLINDVHERLERVDAEDGLSPTALVPADMVLASASGLDPHISLEGALLQTTRVARARRMAAGDVKRLVERMTEGWNFFGPRRVNVLELNVALDAVQGK